MKYKCTWVKHLSPMEGFFTVGKSYSLITDRTRPLIETDFLPHALYCRLETQNTLIISGFNNDIGFEKVEKDTIETKNWKAVIIPDKNNPEKTILKYYENGTLVKEESVRRFHEDKYDSTNAIKAVVEKAFPDVKEKTKPEEVKTPKYKVGDRVVVRKDLKSGEIYGTELFVFNMTKFIGKIITIQSIDERNRYRIKEDTWNWTEEMFEGLAPKYYNGKVICTNSHSGCFTKGKIYEIKDGFLTFDLGKNFYHIPYLSFEDFSSNVTSSFVEVQE